MRPHAFERVEKADVLRLRLQRAIKNLAIKLGLDPVKLELMSDRICFRCAVCLQPFSTPRIYYWTSPEGEQIPRAVICPYCDAAIKKCDNNVDRMARHKRFLATIPNRNARVGRIFVIDQVKNLFDEPVDGEP